ncbi:flap endonuclease GEN-like 2 isoform X2 [Ipomoea triloba]|uniref:flap endonuclease GEN-like 2 isoform X2 n=1 Tax=Ipomoea triloba TaxID=35885 RepID=UPI00125E59BE|nr:flap endonuclease GEN-like 2 isoform X2 [Ipomoea triloba]
MPDGAIPAIKSATYRRRLNVGNELSQEEPNIKQLSSIRRNSGSEFSCMIKEAKVLGRALGIPCLDGIEEAEAQCALLNSESLCDGCFTADSDAFLFGARTVYRDICLGDGGYVVCYEMDDIERKLGFGRNSLITLAVILGGDYSQGVYGIGRESACQIVKSLGDSTVLQRIASEGLSFVKKTKNSKRHIEAMQCDNKENFPINKDVLKGIKCDLLQRDKDKQVLQVINAYLEPRCHSVDSDGVHRVLAVYPFERNQFQQICAKYFDWPPEKTDEYILPKIAERELRRFSNLRSASTKVGLQVSLDEMPIKCPVSSIIKERKVQGRDSFEVSWDGVEGLETSIVPADLVQSACPEKIMEFQERRAQRKKPKSRRRRVDNRPPSSEIELKLQALLLEIDQENTTVFHGSIRDATLRHTQLLTTLEGGQSRENAVPGSPHVTDLSSSPPSHACLPQLYLVQYAIPASPEVTDLSSPPPPRKNAEVETEVIDLLSPPQASRHDGGSSELQIDDVQRPVDVIEVMSDSDNEMFSPDHLKKARELRSFLASIREDIS